MEAWWTALSGPLQWFYAIAISTSVLMVIQLVLMLFAFDADDFDDPAGAGRPACAANGYQGPHQGSCL